MKKLLPIISLVFLFSSCTTEKQVRAIALEYLTSTYNRDFVITAVDMNRNEGNWGKADIDFSPADDPQLQARLVYDYTENRLMFENYAAEVWNRQILLELEQALDYDLLFTDVRLRADNSLTLNTMDLDYGGGWYEAVPTLNINQLRFLLSRYHLYLQTDPVLHNQICKILPDNMAIITNRKRYLHLFSNLRPVPGGCVKALSASEPVEIQCS